MIDVAVGRDPSARADEVIVVEKIGIPRPWPRQRERGGAARLG
jgi:hypothetical protein